MIGTQITQMLCNADFRRFFYCIKFPNYMVGKLIVAIMMYASVQNGGKGLSNFIEKITNIKNLRKSALRSICVICVP
jgi:hypothetical protein